MIHCDCILKDTSSRHIGTVVAKRGLAVPCGRCGYGDGCLRLVVELHAPSAPVTGKCTQRSGVTLRSWRLHVLW